MKTRPILFAMAFTLALCAVSCGSGSQDAGKGQAAGQGITVDPAAVEGHAGIDPGPSAASASPSAGEASAKASDAAASAGTDGTAPQPTGSAQPATAGKTAAAAKPSTPGKAPATAKPAGAKPETPLPAPDAPTITAAARLSARAIKVEISAVGAGVQVRYTLDDTEPTATKGTVYAKPFDVAATKTLKCLAFRAADGAVSPLAAERFTVGELFVAPGAAGDGRIDAPLGRVAAAVAKAAAEGYGAIKVAAGTYTEQVVLSAAVSLSGSWSPTFSARDASARSSVLRAPDDLPSSVAKPSAALRVEGKVERATLVEGFTFRGGEAGYTAGVVVDGGASPSFRRCAIEGGFGSYAYGARTLGGATPLFQYCRLSGGEGGTTSALSCDKSAAEVSSSTLAGGDGTQFSYGVTGINSSFSVLSCLIESGSSATSYGVACYSGSNARIAGCTIVAGRALQSFGIFIADARPTIVNCIITANGKEKSYGIYENYGESDPLAVENCCIFACASGLYFDDDLKLSLGEVDGAGNFAAGGKALASPAAKACVAADPLFAALRRLGPSSPGAVKAGGKEGATAADIDGRARTSPPSIGAHEAD